MLQEGNRETTIILIVIFLITIMALIVIALSITQLLQQTGGLVEQQRTYKIPSVFNKPKEARIDLSITNTGTRTFNFEIKEEGAYFISEEKNSFNFNVSEKSDYFSGQNVDTGRKDLGLVSEAMQYKTKIIQETTEEVDFGDLIEVKIPSIGVQAPIGKGYESAEILEQGWWLYPGSFVYQDGEKILYCHRRYFGRYDPKSCWNLNQVENGDEVIISSSKGEEFTYSVFSTLIVHQSVTNLMKPSIKNYVKIISCGLEDGTPGGSEYRVVVLARLE